MLSPATMTRLLAAHRYGQVYEAMAANGQCLPAWLPAWGADARLPALAMVLRRVVELTRGSQGVKEQWTQELLDAQLADGSFEGNPLTTAVAAAALHLLMQDRRLTRLEIQQAHARAVDALAAMKQDMGWTVEAAGGYQPASVQVTAYILQLLSRNTVARVKLRLDTLWDTLAQRLHQLEPAAQTSLRLARAGLGQARAA